MPRCPVRLRYLAGRRDGIADVALSHRLHAQRRWHGAIDLFYSGGGKPHRETVATGGTVSVWRTLKH